MASREQQALQVETFLALRKALKRKAYDSDSDSSIDKTTNRGNKLKKRARYAREGQLTAPTGPSVHKEVVDYAGYHRTILYHNPPLVDEDGYEVDSEDDEQYRAAVESAAERNPYAGIRLESILAPLTSVTELPAHPTLSRPFTSKALTELAGQGSSWMHKENAALWKVKPLLTKFSGDHTWAACDLLVSDNDADLFEDAFTTNLSSRATDNSAAGASRGTITPRINGESASAGRQGPVHGDAEHHSEPTEGKADPDATLDADISMADASTIEVGPTQIETTNPPEQTNGDNPAGSSVTEADDAVDAEPAPSLQEQIGDKPESKSNGVDKKEVNESSTDDQRKQVDGNNEDTETVIDANGDDAASKVLSRAAPSEVNGHRAVSSTPDVQDEQSVHPLFLALHSTRADRDLGIPDQEAEDVRRLLQLWVQKQEEVTRGTKKLYDGLLRADRLRKRVFGWAKAEAHCGPNRDLSDGEDWYDKEEWGLPEDLKKGHDEEEEDTQQTAKKTRARR